MTGGLFNNRNKDLKYSEKAYLKIDDFNEKTKYETITLRRWDAYYKEIVRAYPDFIITKKLMVNLTDPFTILPGEFKKYFGRDRNCQTPFSLEPDQLQRLLQLEQSR